MLAINGEVESKDMSNRLPLSSVESFSSNWSYEGLGFKVKELSNVNSTSCTNKSKAVCSRVNKGSKWNSISIL